MWRTFAFFSVFYCIVQKLIFLYQYFLNYDVVDIKWKQKPVIFKISYFLLLHFLCFRVDSINAASMVCLASEERQCHLKVIHKTEQTWSKFKSQSLPRATRVGFKYRTSDSMLCCGRRKVITRALIRLRTNYKLIYLQLSGLLPLIYMYSTKWRTNYVSTILVFLASVSLITLHAYNLFNKFSRGIIIL